MDSSSSVRTSTVKTETRSAAVDDAPAYRPSVNARTVVIQRSSYGGGLGGAGGASSVRERVSTGHAGANIPAGAYALVSSSGVSSVKTSREQEKKDMQDLNERFASYIEKVATCRGSSNRERKCAKNYDK